MRVQYKEIHKNIQDMEAHQNVQVMEIHKGQWIYQNMQDMDISNDTVLYTGYGDKT